MQNQAATKAIGSVEHWTRTHHPYTFLDDLARAVNDCLPEEKPVLVCVIGKAGTGKTTFGRWVKKHGFGPFKPRDVALIDSHVMRVPFAFFFTRRIRIKDYTVDELEPFKKYCRGKKVLFFVNRDPAKRITRASIILRLMTDEDTRLQRLHHRNGPENGTLRFHQTFDCGTEVRIAYKHFLEVKV